MISACWYVFCIIHRNLPVNSNFRGGADERTAKGKHGHQAKISTGRYHPDDALRIDRNGDRYRRPRRKTIGYAGDARIAWVFLSQRECCRFLIPEQPQDRGDEKWLVAPNLKHRRKNAVVSTVLHQIVEYNDYGFNDGGGVSDKTTKRHYWLIFRNFPIFKSAKGALDHLLTLIHPLRRSSFSLLSFAPLLSRPLKKNR
jgi:hypothetical protein